MDDCVFPDEIMVLIGWANNKALLRLSMCCKSLFVEFHGHKMTHCVGQYRTKDKNGNIIHLFTNKRNSAKIIQSIKYIDKIKTTIIVWLNTECRTYQHFTLYGRNYRQNTPYKSNTTWGRGGIDLSTHDEYEQELRGLLESGVPEYGAPFEQTVWDASLGRNINTNDLINDVEDVLPHA